MGIKEHDIDVVKKTLIEMSKSTNRIAELDIVASRKANELLEYVNELRAALVLNFKVIYKLLELLITEGIIKDEDRTKILKIYEGELKKFTKLKDR